eukprot:NODE_49_length_27162_cov_0.380039.p13 type:complete len:122 gc:universal NODE_49_length_27162_cov_0.380039:25489-25124(-)
MISFLTVQAQSRQCGPNTIGQLSEYYCKMLEAAQTTWTGPSFTLPVPTIPEDQNFNFSQLNQPNSTPKLDNSEVLKQLQELAENNQQDIGKSVDNTKVQQKSSSNRCSISSFILIAGILIN